MSSIYEWATTFRYSMDFPLPSYDNLASVSPNMWNFKKTSFCLIKIVNIKIVFIKHCL